MKRRKRGRGKRRGWFGNYLDENERRAGVVVQFSEREREREREGERSEGKEREENETDLFFNAANRTDKASSSVGGGGGGVS